jgi:hypothetical protein
LEVLIAHKAISIHVKLSEDLKVTDFVTLESGVLDLGEDRAEATSCGFVSNLTSSYQVLVHERRRRVGPLLSCDCQRQFVGVFLKNKRGDSLDISSSVGVELEGRKEALKVLLSQLPLSNLVSASFTDQNFHLVDVDVTVFVRVDLFAEESLKTFWGLELVLQVATHLNELALDGVQLVGRDTLAIQHAQIISKSVLVDKRTNERVSARGNRAGTLRQNTKIGLIVVIELAQVNSHILVID